MLVAHSAGGGPASLAAERAPELVDRLVYLSAFVPGGRPRFFDYLNAPQNATALGQGLFLGDAGALGAVRINPLSTDPRLRRGAAAGTRTPPRHRRRRAACGTCVQPMRTSPRRHAPLQRLGGSGIERLPRTAGRR
ncbi:EstC [[Actinomadura] parvosata subsp. kistnae]|uniref:alpha/beta hydrolase n=1 Tax=[Actinomadura] parvosata TaxID=1955412 RepID=UPI000D2DB3A6|nr:alpha/beta hydrolase [Nonomuraea sp. ATCC 55076]SPL88626.1 EstC [Actinomadura parvosata subsp. kistnae]